MSNIVKHQQQTTLNLFDPEQFERVQKLAQFLSNSELVPDMYRVTDKNSVEKATANCIIAIEMAQRTGAAIPMVMQNLVIVHGRPSWSSKFLTATINTCGKYDTLRYKFTNKGKIGKIDEVILQYDQLSKKKTPVVVGQKDYGNLEDIECVAYTTEKATGEVLESSPVSIKMAILEGWYEKNGSKWQTMPTKMLKYRAASFWTNEYAPEISMGMHTTEEVEEFVETEDIEHEDITDSVNREAKQKAAQTTVSFSEDKKEPEKQEKDLSSLAKEAEKPTEAEKPPFA